MRISSLLAVAGLAGLLSFAATAQATTHLTTEEFVRQASASNRFEIESSQLALQKTQHADVKTLAQKMIDDHTRAGEKLTGLVRDSKLDAALAQAPLADKQRDIMQELRDASADDFDEEYLEAQEDAHEDAIKLFRQYADHGDHAALQTFARQTLPTLEQHKESVKAAKEAIDE